MIRIAHATDIHWMTTPPPASLLGKRFLGTANLYLRGRRHAFSAKTQTALVQSIMKAGPDALVISGDLTAQALPAEFEVARGTLKELIAQMPTFVVPGNHDVYTQGAKKNRRIQHYFGDLMGLSDDSSLGVMALGNYLFIGLNPNRPTVIQASGMIPERQLTELKELLSSELVTDKNLVLVIHYPILGTTGKPYDNTGHGLPNVHALIEILENAPKRPMMVLHGHKHHGYQASIQLTDGSVPTINPGAGGMTRDPKRNHTGAYNIYTLDGPNLVKIERFIWSGEAFLPEDGGCYNSGW